MNTPVAQVAAGRSRIAAPVVAALLGIALLYFAGFSHIEALHDGAHDARHSAALPCH
jgi:cobalt transporter subunit CbtB